MNVFQIRRLKVKSLETVLENKELVAKDFAINLLAIIIEDLHNFDESNKALDIGNITGSYAEIGGVMNRYNDKINDLSKRVKKWRKENLTEGLKSWLKIVKDYDHISHSVCNLVSAGCTPKEVAKAL